MTIETLSKSASTENRLAARVWCKLPGLPVGLEGWAVGGDGAGRVGTEEKGCL